MEPCEGVEVVANRDRLFVVLGLVACLLLLVGCSKDSPPDKDPADPSARSTEVPPIEAAKAELARGDLPAAQRSISAHLIAQPEDAEGLEIAGDISTATGNGFEEAAQHYRAAINASKPAAAALYDKLFWSWMNNGSPYEAVEVLRELVETHPDISKARSDYAGLSAYLGMTQNSAEHLRWLLRRGRGGINELIMLADLNVPQTRRPLCEDAIKKQPEDLRPRFALAVEASYEDQWAEAEQLLAPVLKRHPDFAPAWALYTRVLVALGKDAELQELIQKLPEGTDQWSQYWIAAGLYSEKQNRPRDAAQALWKAVQIDDCNAEALSHLAANLAQLGMADEAKVVAERAANVNEMHDSIESLFSWRRNSQKAALRVAAAMNRLGRPWEAEGWARASLAMSQELDPSAGDSRQTYRDQLQSNTPWQIPDATVLNVSTLRSLGDFRWNESSDVASSTNSIEPGRQSLIRFADEAAERGLIHTCKISQDRESSIAIFQSNAGGCGVIDFDLDGWPDTYLTMVDGTPMQENSSPNELFRNVEGQFSRIPMTAGIEDRGFTQGVAVGDYNSDGFADLFVASIGRNRLYRNNGDGTFKEVSDDVGLSGKRWTSSVAIVDIDGDGISDLFEVNYCAGDSVYSQECIDADTGEPRSCSPLVFPAEPDRVWRGTARGKFEDASDSWLEQKMAGHGLGLVIGEIDDQPGMDVYVANDMTANQFWSSSSGDDHRMVDQAAVRGLAVNSRSKSQASMGIAIGDADVDGDLDLYLTHFTDDYNTLYEQVSPGTWFDRTEAAGLVQPTLKTLAFGTEWIDADNRGGPELLVANGNVDDFAHFDLALRMPPQLFARSANGSWQQPPTLNESPYFQRRVVGRALVVLDLNRDGKQDAIVTHLFDPVAALVNTSDVDARSVRLFLRGTKGNRDAIGARVEAKVGNQSRVMQLTAGDGYQCSNERCISIGLGNESAARSVTVDWASGESESLGDLAGGRSYIIVEGEQNPFELFTHE